MFIFSLDDLLDKQEKEELAKDIERELFADEELHAATPQRRNTAKDKELYGVADTPFVDDDMEDNVDPDKSEVGEHKRSTNGVSAKPSGKMEPKIKKNKKASLDFFGTSELTADLSAAMTNATSKFTSSLTSNDFKGEGGESLTDTGITLIKAKGGREDSNCKTKIIDKSLDGILDEFEIDILPTPNVPSRSTVLYNREDESFFDKMVDINDDEEDPILTKIYNNKFGISSPDTMKSIDDQLSD